MSIYSGNKKILISACAFLAIIIAVYYPVAANIRTFINGSLDDAYAIIWQLWWFKYSILELHQNPFASGYVESPFGVPVTYMTIANHLIALPFTCLLGPVGSYNVMILLSFFLSAVGMYLLVLEITENHAASFFSGLAYSFSPYHTAFSATGGMDAAQIQYMPLTLLFILRCERSHSGSDLLLFIAFFALTLFSFGYYAALITLAVLIYLVYTRAVPYICGLVSNRYAPVCQKGPPEAGRMPGAGKVLIYAAMLYVFFVIADNAVSEAASFLKAAMFFTGLCAFLPALVTDFKVPVALRNISEALKSLGTGYLWAAYGAAFFTALTFIIFLLPVWSPASRNISSSYLAPLYSYLVPAPDHPVLGRFIPAVLTPKPDPFLGKMVYAGIVIVSLSVLALLWKDKEAARRGLNRGFFAAVFFSGLFLSIGAAVNIGDFNFFGPIYYFHKLMPPFVDIRRVVLLILLGACVLSGISLSRLSSFCAGPARRAAVFIPALLLMFIEFLPKMDFKDLSVMPSAYRWLAQRQGDLTVIEYPLTSIYDSKRYEPFYGQTVHKKRLINPFGALGQDPRPYNGLLRALIDKGGPANDFFANTENAAGALSFLKVGYIVLRTDKMRPGIDTENVFENNVRNNPGALRKAAVFNDSMVFEVTARPATAVISFMDFFRPGYFLNYIEKEGDVYRVRNPYITPPETWGNGRAWLWMGQRAALKIITLVREDRAYDLHFTARSALPGETVLTVKVDEQRKYEFNLSREPAEFIVKNLKLNPGEDSLIVRLEVTGEKSLKYAEGFTDPSGGTDGGAFIGAGISGAVLRESKAGFTKASNQTGDKLKDFDGLFAGGQI